MNRRAFVTSLGALLATPLAAEAQAGKTVRIGVLWPGISAPRSPRVEAFGQGLSESGYIDGRNVAVEMRHAESRERLRMFAAEFV